MKASYFLYFNNSQNYLSGLAFILLICVLNRGSYMSAHVLLNLLNELGKKIRCEALQSILSVSPTSLI